MKFAPYTSFVLLLCSCFAVPGITAETGVDAWLRYARLDAGSAAQYNSLPMATLLLGDSPVLTTAQAELLRGMKGMLGRTLRVASGAPDENAILIGTLEQLQNFAPDFSPNFSNNHKLRPDGFWLTSGQVRGFHCILILGANDRGALYGVFAFLSRIARGLGVSALNDIQQPSAPLRWVNQ